MIRLAYILAASHSGSTLLSMLLGSHPQIATVGEMKLSPQALQDTTRYRCSCGRLIHECSFWQNVGKGMAQRGFEFDLAGAGTDYRSVTSEYARRLLRPLHRGEFMERVRDVALGLSPTWRKQSSEIHRRNAALALTISEITKADVLVDSSKTALRLKYLLRNPELDVKVIRLLRDGRAVALTYMDEARFADAKDPVLRGGGMAVGQQRSRLSIDQAARRWLRCAEEADNLLRGLAPSRWIEVRYEDYCKATEETINRLQRFLGVKPCVQLREFRAIEQHVVGNGMRLDGTSEVKLDERWREELSEQQLRVFDDIAGSHNRRYGYA